MDSIYAITCPKCSGAIVTKRYHRTHRQCGYGAHGESRNEHLHYTCTACNYDWTGPTADTEARHDG